MCEACANVFETHHIKYEYGASVIAHHHDVNLSHRSSAPLIVRTHCTCLPSVSKFKIKISFTPSFLYEISAMYNEISLSVIRMHSNGCVSCVLSPSHCARRNDVDSGVRCRANNIIAMHCPWCGKQQAAHVAYEMISNGRMCESDRNSEAISFAAKKWARTERLPLRQNYKMHADLGIHRKTDAEHKWKCF